MSNYQFVYRVKSGYMGRYCDVSDNPRVVEGFGDRDSAWLYKDEIPTPIKDTIVGIEYIELDNCSKCKGSKGGLPGNENVLEDGTVVCDYCHKEQLSCEQKSHGGLNVSH